MIVMLHFGWDEQHGKNVCIHLFAPRRIFYSPVQKSYLRLLVNINKKKQKGMTINIILQHFYNNILLLFTAQCIAFLEKVERIPE